MGKITLMFLVVVALSIVVNYGQGQTATGDCNSIIYRDGKTAACIKTEVIDNILNLKIYPQEGWGVPNRASLIETLGLKLKPIPIGNIRFGYDEDISVLLKDVSIWYNYEGKGSYPATDKVSELPSFVAPLILDLMTCGHLNVIGLDWIPMGTLWEEFGFKGEFDDLSTLPVNPQFSDNNNYDNCMIVWPDQPMKLKSELLDSAYLDYLNYISIRIPLGVDKDSKDKYIHIYVKLLLAKLTDLSYVCKYASCEFKIPIIKTTTEKEVIFPDPNLEAAIREAINKPKGSIYIPDLDGLKNLYANKSDIKDIVGLEYCNNLKTLSLWDNQIVDLSPLSGLTNLEVLDLSGNQITDLSPLSGLTNLSELGLGGNQITDLSPLSGLTNLGGLYLNDNQIIDVSPLSGLTNLYNLELSDNQITDLSPLSGLTNLDVLWLISNQITDLSPISGLTNLVLITDDNQITESAEGSIDGDDSSSGDISAEIVERIVWPTGTFKPWDQVAVEYTIKNTGTETHDFYLGASVRGPDDQWQDMSYRVKSGLGPGKSYLDRLVWRVPRDAPAGNYDITIAVWKDKTTEGDELVDELDRETKEDLFRVEGITGS